jgi:hypothetical protein
MKLRIGLLALGLSMNVFAGAGGHGGSGTESEIAASTNQVEVVTMKLKRFFSKNVDVLKGVFPEVEIPLLLEKFETAQLKVVTAEVLIDKNGVSRSCLNYQETNLIECKNSEIARLVDRPLALFVLVFHEYLGLMGVEETSPTDAAAVDGYKISRRLSGYLTKVVEYDLQISGIQELEKQLQEMKKISPYKKQDGPITFNDYLTEYRKIEDEIQDITFKKYYSQSPEHVEAYKALNDLKKQLKEHQCEYKVSGKNNDIESHWMSFDIQRDYLLSLYTSNTLGRRESMNPVRDIRYVDMVTHELFVKTGDLPGTLTFTLTTSCTPRNQRCGADQTVKNVPIKNLNLKMRWELLNTVKVTCK